MTATCPTGVRITPENRDWWLAQRPTFIGASEAHDVCIGDPLKTYLRKTGFLGDEPASLQMRMGNMAEPMIRELYETEGYGRIADTQIFLRSPSDPFIGATLDGIREDGELAEWKLVNAFRRDEFGDPGSEDIPEKIYFQAQQQMFCFGARKCDVAVFFGSLEFAVFPIHRSQAVIDGMLPIEAAFWRQVESRLPPDATSRTDADLLAALYPWCEGFVMLPEHLGPIVDQYVATGITENEAKKERQGLRSLILAALGEAATGELPDGRTVNRSIVNVKAHAAQASKQVRLSVKESR